MIIIVFIVFSSVIHYALLQCDGHLYYPRRIYEDYNVLAYLLLGRLIIYMSQV